MAHAHVDAVREVLAAAHEVVPVDLDRAQAASALMSATGLRRVPSIVITSDPGTWTLVDSDARGRRVAVWRV